MNHAQTTCPVSIIIPAYNCDATIAKTISACLAQDCSVPIEIIVVDDGSTDGTAERVRAFPGVRYARQENAGPASARNHGARLAGGEVLLFTDSDCVPHPDWASRLLSGLKQQEVAAVAGSYGIANPESLLARCVQSEIIYRHLRMPGFIRAFGSYNVAIKRGDFLAVGGFDERYRHASGEDNDLSYKFLAAGKKICFAREALVDHHHPVRVAQYLREQFRHGAWRVRMYRSHPRMMAGDDYTFWKDSGEVLLALMSLSFLLFFVCLKTFPIIFAFGCVVLLALLNGIFGLLMTGRIGAGLFFGAVMSLRAYARALGLIYGLFASKKFGY